MTDEKLSPREYLREHDADGNARVRHTHDPASGLETEDGEVLTCLECGALARGIHAYAEHATAHALDVRKRVASLEAELGHIDQVLARRPALDGEATRAAKIEKAISVAKEADGLRAMLGQLNGKLDNLLTHRCVKCGTTIPGDEVLRQRIRDLEWAEVRVKKLEELLLQGARSDAGTDWANAAEALLAAKPVAPRCRHPKPDGSPCDTCLEPGPDPDYF